jgi:hypothetical protein
MNVRSRSYSALPAPVHSPPYLQAVRQEIRVRALAAGAISPLCLVGSSSIFIPIGLDSFTERVTVERTEVLDPPHIVVDPPSDGMKWTVSARRRIRACGLIWRNGGRGNGMRQKGNIGTVVAGAPLCPVGAL